VIECLTILYCSHCTICRKFENDVWGLMVQSVIPTHAFYGSKKSFIPPLRNGGRRRKPRLRLSEVNHALCYDCITEHGKSMQILLFAAASTLMQIRLAPMGAAHTLLLLHPIHGTIPACLR
jgi:hypothetical protein